MSLTGTVSSTPAALVTAADAHPLVRRVREYADTVLRPTALRTDRDGVTKERIAELQDVGLLNHLAPTEYGGHAAGRDVDRRLHEIVAGACFNTWLVWAQHGPLANRLSTRDTHSLLPEPFEQVLRGQVLIGAGVSDVRRYPRSTPLAAKVEGGWTLTGTISWVSGWGLNSALTVSAVEPVTETVITALVQVSERTTAQPLDLKAVGGSRTQRVHLSEVFVPDDHVVDQQTLEQWRSTDLGTAADARPHHFGLADTVLGELDQSDQAMARQVAAVWRPRMLDIRLRAYGLADEAAARGGGPYRLDDRLATRVESGEALSAVTKALLISRSGRGLGGDDTAQLYARSALFVLVQGQTADVRRVQLEHLAR